MNIPEKVVALGRMGIYLVLTGTEHCGSGGSALDNFFGRSPNPLRWRCLR